MKIISTLFLLLGILIAIGSLRYGQYNALRISLLSISMWYLTRPEKKKEEEPFRSHKTWKDEEED